MSDRNRYDAPIPEGTPESQLTTAQKYNDIGLFNVEDLPTLRAKLLQRGYTPLQINGVIRFLLESNWELIREWGNVRQDLEPIL